MEAVWSHVRQCGMSGSVESCQAVWSYVRQKGKKNADLEISWVNRVLWANDARNDARHDARSTLRHAAEEMLKTQMLSDMVGPLT